MRTAKQQISVIVIALSVMFILQGCMPNSVVYQSKDLNVKNIDKISVAPLVDNRRAIVPRINFEKARKDIENRIVKALKRKKYDADLINGNNPVNDLNPSQIPLLSSQQIRQMYSGGSQWILIPVVDSYYKEGVAFKRGLCEMTFYQYDTQKGILMWEASADGKNIRDTVNILFKKYPKKK